MRGSSATAASGKQTTSASTACSRSSRPKSKQANVHASSRKHRKRKENEHEISQSSSHPTDRQPDPGKAQLQRTTRPRLPRSHRAATDAALAARVSGLDDARV